MYAAPVQKQQQVCGVNWKANQKAGYRKCPIPQRGKLSLWGIGHFDAVVCSVTKVPDSLEQKLSAPGTWALQHKSLQAVCCHTAEAAEVQQSTQRLSIMHRWSRRMHVACNVSLACKQTISCLP
jgi:hypothetical protein